MIKIWTITSYIKPKYSTKKLSNDVQIKLEHLYDGHCSAVTCVKYNNSGTYLISSSLDKLVKIWDNTGSCICTLEGHNRYVNCVTFSRDSCLAVSGMQENSRYTCICIRYQFIKSKGSTGSNDKLLLVWDLTGDLTFQSEFNKPHMLHYSTHLGDIEEQVVVRNAETGSNKVILLEKLDDISEGAVNSCSFFQNILAIGCG